MKQIYLTQGKVAFVDDEDYEWLNSFKWHVYKNGNNFYAVRSVWINGKRTTQHMHQLIMGDNSLKLMIDHMDGNGCNNQKANLRFCTHQENQMNRNPNKNCSSIYKGVSWNKATEKWVAQIHINRKQTNIGFFNVEEDAAKTYDAAAIKYYGEFAYLNFK